MLELERMKGSYRAIPVPTYNIDNHLIHPASYRHELQGALVEIHFTLSHCTFKNKVLENDIVMSSSLFMLITYYSVMIDTYERD